MNEKRSWESIFSLFSNNFKNVKNEISGMGIVASINNYDIVNTLGEDNIRQTLLVEEEPMAEEYKTNYGIELNKYSDFLKSARWDEN